MRQLISVAIDSPGEVRATLARRGLWYSRMALVVHLIGSYLVVIGLGLQSAGLMGLGGYCLVQFTWAVAAMVRGKRASTDQLREMFRSFTAALILAAILPFVTVVAVGLEPNDLTTGHAVYAGGIAASLAVLTLLQWRRAGEHPVVMREVYQGFREVLVAAIVCAGVVESLVMRSSIGDLVAGLVCIGVLLYEVFQVQAYRKSVLRF